jgi:hypothetical protein
MTTQSLQERISGTVVYRGDPNYERARRTPGWNELKPDRYPDLIVQVASEDDIVETVNFARAQHTKIFQAAPAMSNATATRATGCS